MALLARTFLTQHTWLWLPFVASLLTINAAWISLQFTLSGSVAVLPYPLIEMVGISVSIGISCSLVTLIISGCVNRFDWPTTLQSLSLRRRMWTWIATAPGILLSSLSCILVLVDVAADLIRSRDYDRALVAYNQFGSLAESIECALHSGGPSHAASWTIGTARDFKRTPLEEPLWDRGIVLIRRCAPEDLATLLSDYAQVKDRYNHSAEAEAIYAEVDRIISMALAGQAEGCVIVSQAEADKHFSKGGAHDMRRAIWARFYNPPRKKGSKYLPGFYLIPKNAYAEPIPPTQ